MLVGDRRFMMSQWVGLELTGFGGDIGNLSHRDLPPWQSSTPERVDFCPVWVSQRPLGAIMLGTVDLRLMLRSTPYPNFNRAVGSN